MKRAILILIMAVFAIGLQAQERTVERLIKGTYKNYTGAAADTLISTNQDTIDVVFEYNGPGYVNKLSVKSRFDVISGADTTVAVSVFGKEFEDDETYIQIIASTLTSAIAADNTVQVLSSDYTETTAAFDVPYTNPTAGTVDTLEYPIQIVTPLDKSYRFYRVRYIIQGDDSVGTGIKLDDVEFKLYANSSK